MKGLRWTLVLTCFALMAVPPIPAWANDTDEDTTQLEDMTVSAQKEMTVSTPKRDQAIKDEVGKEEIDIPTVSGSILDALQNEAGIQLRRSSASGTDRSKLRLRGFDETRLRMQAQMRGIEIK